MTREIKFRAWEKAGKVMIDWFTMTQTAFNRSGEHDQYGILYRVMTGNPEMELMQYTCLKDKNGKEIYEGDIVKAERSYWNEPRNLIVEWFGERYGLINPKDSVDSEVMDKESCFNVSENEREIIGNIYENPELLTSR